MSEYHMIFHGDLNYQGHGDLKSDLQPSFHLKYHSLKKPCMLLPQFANCFSIYRLNKLTIMSKVIYDRKDLGLVSTCFDPSLSSSY